MQSKTLLILLVSLLLIQIAVLGRPVNGNHIESTKQPMLIRQGPIQSPDSTCSPGPCWFQEGAIGDVQTYKSVGANITIRTVYDRLNSDAHSYWVGSLLANGAFAQVGYLNGLTTTNQQYCCAWFFEYFPPPGQPGSDNSPPIIGPEGSAGPIGSWHSYSMISDGNGIWSFYMDNQRLGTSPGPGGLYYLGSGASDTGSHPPAALAEVAQTINDKDIIGPAEFKDLSFETVAGNWQRAPVGIVHIGLGAHSATNLPNPYSVVEVEAIQNDFLAGSYIPKPRTGLNPDPCGNPDPTKLWTTMPSPCTPSTSFTFVDQDGGSILPLWMSLNNTSNLQIFYTSYANQIVPSTGSGNWIVNQVSWHSVNVATLSSFAPSASSVTIPTNVFSVTLSVVGYFFSIPVANATVRTSFPDSIPLATNTDSSGQAILSQLPPSNYPLHIIVPNGISSNTNRAINGPGTVTARVFSLPELVTIIVVSVVAAVLVVSAAWKREQRRQAMLPPITTPFPVQLNCVSCGQPLLSGAAFCANCGTPVRRLVP